MLRRYLIIIVLATLTCAVGYKLPWFKALDFFAILLGMIAGIYIGFAIQDGRTSRIALEGSVALGFVALILLGLWRWPVLIATGYFLHGLWDLLHHPFKLGTRVQTWYPPACVVYDWLVGIFIYIYMF